MVRSLDRAKSTTQQQPTRRSETPEERQLRERWNIWEPVLRKIGARYEDASFASFSSTVQAQRDAVAKLTRFCDTLGERTKTGQGIVLIGPRGTGKDHLAVACLRCAVKDFGLRPEWVDGQSLYEQFRDSIDSETRERNLIREYTSPDILLISDPIPQSDSITSFQQSVLWRIVDRRYRDLKPTWVTMNVLNGEEAEKRMGAQLVDRLRDGSLSIVCNWQSFRKSAST